MPGSLWDTNSETWTDPLEGVEVDPDWKPDREALQAHVAKRTELEVRHTALRSIDEWREYLSKDIALICERPSMFGPDAEGLVLTQIQNWAFVRGLEPEHEMAGWRAHVHEAGYPLGCLAFLRDALTSRYNMDRRTQFNEIEYIVGSTLASFARKHGLDVPDPTRRPDRDTAVSGASATSETST